MSNRLPVSWLEHEEETISINYTSGTTGRPKGVQYTYRGAYLNALSEVIVAGMGNDSAYLWTLPMFHCNGWCFPWAVTAVAARHVTMRAVDPGLIWELIDGEGVTHYNGAPTVQLMVVNHPRAHRLERPVTAMVAAAPPSPTLLARMSELNFRVVHVYGLTETYGPITVCPEQEAWRELPVEERARYLARQGQAYPSADLVRVVLDGLLEIPADGGYTFTMTARDGARLAIDDVTVLAASIAPRQGAHTPQHRDELADDSLHRHSPSLVAVCGVAVRARQAARSGRLLVHHGFHDANRRRADEDYKDSGEDEQHQREDQLDCRLSCLLFRELLPPRSH